MRLAQLARKLDVRQTDIVAFLEGKNIDVEKGSNFRLDDATIALILQRFGPLPGTVHGIAQETVPDNDAPDIGEHISRKETSSRAEETTGTDDPEPAENVELIRAPKVELPGLRVVGKIDLPEPKRKTEEADASAATTNVEQESPPAPRKKRRTQTADARNSASVRREREARAAERKRRAEEELEKERRRQKYLSKVRINVPTKPARIYDDEVEELPQEMAEEPKPGLWGRLLGWLFRKS